MSFNYNSCTNQGLYSMSVWKVIYLFFDDDDFFIFLDGNIT